MNILSGLKSDSWRSNCYLFDSVSESNLLYMSEIWARGYGSIIERGQVNFLKKTGNWPNSYPAKDR